MTRVTRIHVDGLSLDLRGLSAQTARAVAPLVGPAVARALAARSGDAGLLSRPPLDAGGLTVPAAASSGDIAERIAAHVATHVATHVAPRR